MAHRRVSEAKIRNSLPETLLLPSADRFAECQKSSTRQPRHIPSVIQKTLGNILTLGKFGFCRVVARKHTVNLAFAECLASGTRQRQHVPAM